MMKIGFLTFMAVMLSTAGATLADSMSFSSDLALIVGSAETCGYRLDEDAVSAYVAANVPASDLKFASMFEIQTGYHRSETKGMSGRELRLRCEAAVRSAKHLNLLAP